MKDVFYILVSLNWFFFLYSLFNTHSGVWSSGPRSQETESEAKRSKMASPTARLTFRVVMIALAVLVLFYMGRPLYWKISATIHEIRENKQTVKQGTLTHVICISVFLFVLGIGFFWLLFSAANGNGFRFIADCAGSSENCGLVSRRVGFGCARRSGCQEGRVSHHPEAAFPPGFMNTQIQIWNIA